MRYILVALFGALAYYLYPSETYGVPFANLTPGDIWHLIGAVVSLLVAVGLLLLPSGKRRSKHL